MNNLDSVVNILIKEHKSIASGDINLSGISDNERKKVLELAVEKAKSQNNEEAVKHFLFYMQDWPQLLELATKKINDPDPSIQVKGLKSLWPLVHKDQQIPTAFAVRLAEVEMRENNVFEQLNQLYAIKRLFYFGNVKEEALEMGYRLLNEGIVDGIDFVEMGGHKLTSREVNKFAKILMKKNEIRNVVALYEQSSSGMSTVRARELISIARSNSNKTAADYAVEAVFKYMEKMNIGLSKKDYKEQGDFDVQHDDVRKALGYYKKAGEEISDEELKNVARLILNKNENALIVSNANNYGLAQNYLDLVNKDFARKVLRHRAAELADTKPLEVKKIYELIGENISERISVIAAKKAETDEEYDLAAEFYSNVGDIESINRMGYDSLNKLKTIEQGIRSRNFHYVYGAQKCFELSKDQIGLELVKQLEKKYT